MQPRVVISGSKCVCKMQDARCTIAFTTCDFPSLVLVENRIDCDDFQSCSHKLVFQGKGVADIDQSWRGPLADVSLDASIVVSRPVSPVRLSMSTQKGEPTLSPITPDAGQSNPIRDTKAKLVAYCTQAFKHGRAHGVTWNLVFLHLHLRRECVSFLITHAIRRTSMMPFLRAVHR